MASSYSGDPERVSGNGIRELETRVSSENEAHAGCASSQLNGLAVGPGAALTTCLFIKRGDADAG
jgi:hypothetical protein